METRILVGTAISGGTLRGLLEEAIEKHGAKRLAVGIERVAMDFPLPCPSGEGKPLTPDALARLRRHSRTAVFFSEALCAKYFTYRSGAETHLVLFDDEDTVHRKQKLARELGIEDVFLMYSPYKA